MNEIDVLKKYNKRMKILKIIIAILSILIIAIWGMIAISYVKKTNEYEKGMYIFNIIAEAYDKIEEIKDSNNYTLVNDYTIDGVTYTITTLYKDGYFREEHEEYTSYINYGVMTSNRTYYVEFDTNLNFANCTNIANVGYSANILDYYYNKNIIEYCDFEIREEKYNENEYYVIRQNISDSNYTDLWINKDDMLFFRFVYGNTENSDVIENKYIWTVGNVTDDDVQLDNLEAFDVEEFAKQFIIEYMQ